MLHASARYQSPHVLQVTRIKVLWRQKYDSLCFFFVRHVRLTIRGPKVILNGMFHRTVVSKAVTSTFI
jgi:hypothetical protein